MNIIDLFDLSDLFDLLCIKSFSETSRSMIVMSLAEEGLGIIEEGMVIVSW